MKPEGHIVEKDYLKVNNFISSAKKFDHLSNFKLEGRLGVFFLFVKGLM